MGSLILFLSASGLLLLVGLSLCILVVKEFGFKNVFTDWSTYLITCFFLIISGLFFGAYKDDEHKGKLTQEQQVTYLKEKQFLEDNLERKDKYFFKYLDDAIEHNNNVNMYNDKWHRFSVEDRSEYMVDIEYYKSTLITDGE